MANLSPDYFMKLFGMGGAGQTSKALTGFDWKKATGIASGLNQAVNSEGTGSKFMGLLKSLGGIGMGQSKRDSDTISGKGMKDFKESDIYKKMGGEVMKISHHRDKGLKPLKNWQHNHLQKYDALRNASMMDKPFYEQQMKRHHIPEEHWYGGRG